MNYYHIFCIIVYENEFEGSQHEIKFESIFPGKNETDAKINAINEYSKMFNCNLEYKDPLDKISYECNDAKYTCNMKGDYIVCNIIAHKYDDDSEELEGWPEVFAEMNYK